MSSQYVNRTPGRGTRSSMTGRFLFPLLAILAVQLVLLVYWQPDARRATMTLGDGATVAYGSRMARGERRAWLSPEHETYRAGDTLTVHFTFACRDTASGDRIFASLLIRSDTRVRISDEKFTSGGKNNHSPHLTRTHVQDTGPVVRGFTVGGLAPGDTMSLAVTLSLDRTSDGADWYFLYGMERDAMEPSDADRIYRRRLIAK